MSVLKETNHDKKGIDNIIEVVHEWNLIFYIFVYISQEPVQFKWVANEHQANK